MVRNTAQHSSYGADTHCLSEGNTNACVVDSIQRLCSLPGISIGCERSLFEIFHGPLITTWVDERRKGIATIVMAAALSGRLNADSAIQILDGGDVARIAELIDDAINHLGDHYTACLSRHSAYPIKRTFSLDVGSDGTEERIIVRQDCELWHVPIDLSGLSTMEATLIYRIITAVSVHGNVGTVDDGLEWNTWLGEGVDAMRQFVDNGMDLCNLTDSDIETIIEFTDEFSHLNPRENDSYIREKAAIYGDIIQWTPPYMLDALDHNSDFSASSLLRDFWHYRKSNPTFYASDFGIFAKKAVLFLRRVERLSDTLFFEAEPIEDGFPLELGAMVSYGEPCAQEVLDLIHESTMNSGEFYLSCMMLADVAGKQLLDRLSVMGEANGLISLACIDN